MIRASTKSGKAAKQATGYRYHALPNAHSIRMLTVHAGSTNQPIQGHLDVFDIASAAEEYYEPLSYVWGDPDRVGYIICDGKRLDINASLHSALRRLRHPDRPRRLWIDQICINQDSLSERSQQVQFMNRIYKNGNHVLVWLGPDDHEVAMSAFAKILELDEIFRDDARRAEFHRTHSDSLDALDESVWIHLKMMTSLPWVRKKNVHQTRASMTANDFRHSGPAAG
jgi:hypothetical protein